MKKTYLIVTTINVPTLLYDYAKNFEKYNHKKEIGMIVIGDLKTPHNEAQAIANDLNSQGFEVFYYNIESQKKWLKNFPELDKMIPYNTDNRRNLGYIIAAQKGAEVLLVIDDDNYPTDCDFYSGHAVVGTRQTLKTLKAENNWVNICSMLESYPERVIYPRGYPYYKRWKDNTRVGSKSTGRVVMNAGLWINDPDVDAVTRLNEPIQTTKLLQERLMIRKNDFTPINTQNTAVHIDILPVYYYVLMRVKFKGLFIDRYGDIWAGFFAKKVIDRMNDRVTVGGPLTDHRRNNHDLLKDLQEELFGMIFTQSLAEILEEIKLTSTTYSDCYLELANLLLEKIQKKSNFDREVKDYFKILASNMKTWANICKKVMKIS